MKYSHHHRKYYRHWFYRLYHPQQRQSKGLEKGKQIYFWQRHVSKINIVRLVLGWHKEQQAPVNKLDA